MAAEVELERLVGHLDGDGRGYLKMMSDARDATERVASTMQSVTSKVDSIGPSLDNAASTIHNIVQQAVATATGMGIVEVIKGTIAEIKEKVAAAREEFEMDPTNEGQEFKADYAAAAFQLIKEKGEAAWGGVKDTIKGTLDTITPMAEKVHSVFDYAWQKMTGSNLIAWERISATINNSLLILELVFRNFGNIASATWDIIRDRAIAAYGAITEFGNSALEWSKGFIARNRETIQTLLAIAGAVVGAYVAYRVMAATIALVNTVIAFLHIQQIAQGAAWLVLKAVVIGLTATILIFNGVLWMVNAAYSALSFIHAAYTSVTAGSTIATVAHTVATIAETAATWLLNTALTVTNTLLGAAVFITAAIVFGAIAAAVTVAGLAAWSLWQGVKAVYDALVGIEGVGKVFGPLVDLVKELNDDMVLVAETMEKDMPIAWELFAAASSYATAKVKQLFPPLWDFIKTGFSITWDLLAAVFEAKMTEASTKVSNKMVAQLLKNLDTFGLFGDQIEEFKKKLDSLTDEAVSLMTSAAVKKAEADLKSLVDNFKLPDDNEEVKKARERLEKAREAARNAVKKEDTEGAEEVAQAFRKAGDEVRSFNAAAYGSADALDRIRRYTEMYTGENDKLTEARYDKSGKLVDTNKKIGSVSHVVAVSGSLGGGGTEELMIMRQSRELLAQIAENTARPGTKKTPKPLGVGGV